MKPEIIVMLTQNDRTVDNAYDIFMSSYDLDVHNWGFKNTGINKDEMQRLVKTMKDKGKKTFLEILAYDETSCFDIVKTAVECEFDEIMGTLYFPSVHQYLNRIKPFVGKVSGIPGILKGTYAEIIADAKQLIEKGVTGFDLLAYRHRENGEDLARQFCSDIKTLTNFPVQVCISGSVSSFKHIDVLLDISPWAFTIGSALFESKFAPQGNFRENLQAVIEYMKR